MIHALREPEEQRIQRLGWSRFRRVHQAGARRCHVERRARQAPLAQPPAGEPLRLPGLPALTDTHWEQLRPLLPAPKPRKGHPAVDHRPIVEGILWVVRTGSAWREVPERFGSWATVAERYYRWRKEGRWTRILQVLQEQEVPISSSA